MILEWIKRRRAAAIEKRKKIEAKYTRELKFEWQQKYFPDIVFPIVILFKDDYLPVYDLSEYYIDTDICIWGVESNCELVDSKGQKYDFKMLESGHWVPNQKTGIMEFEEFRNKIASMIYMPKHEQDFIEKQTIKGIIELLTNE